MSTASPGSAHDELRPPESWPGAAGAKSVTPTAAARRPSGDSWPGAAPAASRRSRSSAPGERPADLRAPAHRVAREAVAMWRLTAALGWLVPLVAVVAWLVLDDGHRGPQLGALAAVVLLGVAHVLVMPWGRYRVHRWEITDDAVYTQTGWWHRERRLAPIARLQTVDSEHGPVERLFGLGTVTVTTASAAGPLKIAALQEADVRRIVADLTAVAARHRGDGT